MEGKNCAVCDKEGRHSCSGCRAVRYCSQDHQKTHWKVHQLDCKPYRIESSAERGDHLVASRNLKPGKQSQLKLHCLPTVKLFIDLQQVRSSWMKIL